MKPVPHEIQDRLKEKVGLHNFETWIKPLQVTDVKDGAVTIEVPSTLFRDWLNDNYLETSFRQNFRATMTNLSA